MVDCVSAASMPQHRPLFRIRNFFLRREESSIKTQWDYTLTAVSNAVEFIRNADINADVYSYLRPRNNKNDKNP